MEKGEKKRIERIERTRKRKSGRSRDKQRREIFLRTGRGPRRKAGILFLTHELNITDTKM